MMTQLNLDQVRRWLDAYIDAWRSYDRDAIADLFTADVRYEPEPYNSLHGRDQVVEYWLEDQDSVDSWRAHYDPIAIDGWLAVATGVSRYFDENGDERDLYHNLFLLEFDPDGRCRHYREWYMRQP